MVEALRTHNRYEERWQPPQTRFVQYEAKDEEWARYCGIGTMARVPLDLWDVRDLMTCKLFGYIGIKPEIVCHELRIPYMSPLPPAIATDPAPRPEFLELRLDARRIVLGGQHFLAWTCSPDTALKLAASGRLVLAEDNLGEFERRVRRWGPTP